MTAAITAVTLPQVKGIIMNGYERSFVLGVTIFATGVTIGATRTYPGLYDSDNFLSLGAIAVLALTIAFGRKVSAQARTGLWVLLMATFVGMLIVLINNIGPLSFVLALVLLLDGGAIWAMYEDLVPSFDKLTSLRLPRFRKPAKGWQEITTVNDGPAERGGFLDSVLRSDFTVS